MSILIKGMDLPESGAITIRINRIGEVIPAYSIFGIPVAEAIEIPPHGRLIDADELLERLQVTAIAPAPSWIRAEIIIAPTIIEAEE